MQKQKLFLTNFEKSQWGQKYFKIAFEFNILKQVIWKNAVYLTYSPSIFERLQCCGGHANITMKSI